MNYGDFIAHKIFKRTVLDLGKCFMCKKMLVNKNNWGEFLFHLHSTHAIQSEDIPTLVREWKKDTHTL